MARRKKTEAATATPIVPVGEEQLADVWPQEAGAHPEKLLDLVKEIADRETVKKIEVLESELEKNKRIASTNGDLGLLQDMPESVLDGRLGELCERFMLAGKRFPIAYAWPAMLAVASALVPRYGEKQRLNLYSALVGAVHSGKTQAIDAAQQLLGCDAPPTVMNVMAGSAESLTRYCGDAQGAARLFSPDELGHLLEKASIQNASFASVLCRAFQHTKFLLLMQQKVRAEFNASLSIVGGIVSDRFEDLFSRSTTAGLYDRFLFGACPDAFRFDYFPFETAKREFQLEAVGVHPDVWVEKSIWLAEDKELEQRVVEIALRAATICASFDGKTLLTANDLHAAREFAQYQQRIRRLLRPNEGENPEAKIALKFTAKLKSLAGKYVSKRELFHSCSAERCGLRIADNALNALHANGDIEVTRGKPRLVRWLLEDSERQEE